MPQQESPHVDTSHRNVRDTQSRLAPDDDRQRNTGSWTGSRRRLVLTIAGIAAGTAVASSEAVAAQLDDATPAVGTPESATPMAGSPVPTSEDVLIPSSPVGDQLAWVLDTIDAAAEDILPSPSEIESHFDPSFLAAISSEDTAIVFAQLAELLAPTILTGFAGPMSETALVALLHGNDDTAWQLQIAVAEEEPHLIIGLFAGPAEQDREPLESWEAFDEELSSLGESVAFHAVEITPDGPATIHSLNSDTPLAIGSTFKLYVLGALAAQIQAGATTWDEEIPIQDEFKSLPTGRMQDEDAGTLFTTREYAELMISISDNTATDHLIHHVGRGNVEDAMEDLGHSDPSLNIPMLTTRELFALKISASDEVVQEYIEGDAEQRLAVLEEDIATLMPTASDVTSWTSPRFIDTIEWFATTQDLTAAMEALAFLATQPKLEPILDILALNPGMEFDRSLLPYVGYKGGSEPGVINLTWLLQRADGRVFSVSATVQDSTKLLDDVQVATLAARAVDLLAATA